jgi:selenocysteine-specific elongation factor
LKSRLNVTSRVFNAALGLWLTQGKFAETIVRQDTPGASMAPVIHMPQYHIVFSSQQKQQMESLLARFSVNPSSPPTIKECVAGVGNELYNAMIDMGYLIPLNSDVVYHREGYENLVYQIRLLLENQGSISVGQVRDTFQTSRRYVLALLEHLDTIGVTTRVGDVRKLKRRSE